MAAVFSAPNKLFLSLFILKIFFFDRKDCSVVIYIFENNVGNPFILMKKNSDV